ncbi:Hypothetical predicted protein [Marmota monax]|uniref:Large ribosomal subunit protein uL23 N-terminal domain-containing protein n=1 Tax=Marmota monax TaxID=9995 RepID=A0A5E4ARD0_MARMO|nr:hypothetical protein GHT09_004187 [Marmota monax]VTJ59898.1 Hypothetical predicted protein [Marmota monax]
MLKGIHSHIKKKIPTSPTFWWLKTLWLWRQPKYPRKSTLKRNKPSHSAIKFHLTTGSVMKKTEDNNTMVSSVIVDVKANKHQIKQADQA